MQAIYNCAFDAHVAVSTIEDEIDLAIEVVHDVLGCGGRRFAGAVGRWSSNGSVTCGDEEAGVLGGWHAEANGFLTWVHVWSELAIFRYREEDGQWAGPEPGDEWCVHFRDRLAHDSPQVLRAGDVGDEWIVVGSTFSGEDTGDSRRVGRIGAESIDCLSRKGYRRSNAIFDGVDGIAKKGCVRAVGCDRSVRVVNVAVLVICSLLWKIKRMEIHDPGVAMRVGKVRERSLGFFGSCHRT